MDEQQKIEKIKDKLKKCAIFTLELVGVEVPSDIDKIIVLLIEKHINFNFNTDNFYYELLNFVNGINIDDEYGRGLDITRIPETNNIQITLHDYKFMPIVPASLRNIKPLSPYCLALTKFINLMKDFALMCQTIILSKKPLSQASVETIIPTDMLSSFHKSKQVCESYNKPDESTRIKNQSLIDATIPVKVTTYSSASDTALTAGGSKSRRRRARKTRRGRNRKAKSKTTSKTHRRRRHSRVRKHKKYTSRR
jgi:hypothetical protein